MEWAGSSWRDFGLPLVLAVGALLVCALFELQPVPGGPVAAVFPLWWNGTRAVLAAAPAGAVIRFGALPSIVILQPLPGGGARLRRAGAWALLNPAALGGCTAGAAAP
jgi:hypothetical protein